MSTSTSPNHQPGGPGQWLGNNGNHLQTKRLSAAEIEALSYHLIARSVTASPMTNHTYGSGCFLRLHFSGSWLLSTPRV